MLSEIFSDNRHTARIFLNVSLVFLIPALALLLVSCGGAPQKPAPEPRTILSLLPSDSLPLGWKASGEKKVYQDRELYVYIDGGADLYLEYGFVRVAAAEYSAGSAAILIDLYQMTDPAAAFGIFSLARSAGQLAAAVGQGAVVNPFQLTFWKGPYYVNVQCLEQGHGDAVESFARLVDQAIGPVAKTTLPLLDRLPGEGLVPGSETLVRGPLGLAARYFLSEENLFALDQEVPAVLGFYRIGGGDDSLLVMLVRYPDNTGAKNVCSNLAGFYLQRENDGEGRLVVSNPGELDCQNERGWDLIRARGAFVAAAFGASSPAAAAFLDQVLGE